MKSFYVAACMLAISVPGLAVAQDTSAPAATETLQADPVPAEEWQAFSKTDRTIYLVRLGPNPTQGDVIQVSVARVPPTGPATDLSYKMDEYEIRCQANKFKMLAEVHFDETGAELDRFAEDSAEWEDIRPAGLPGHFKPLICDGARAREEPAPSIEAFIARGRK